MTSLGIRLICFRNSKLQASSFKPQDPIFKPRGAEADHEIGVCAVSGSKTSRARSLLSSAIGPGWNWVARDPQADQGYEASCRWIWKGECVCNGMYDYGDHGGRSLISPQTSFHICRTSRRISIRHPLSTTTIQRSLFMADGGKKNYKETRSGRSLVVLSPFLNDEKSDITVGPIRVRARQRGLLTFSFLIWAWKTAKSISERNSKDVSSHRDAPLPQG